MYALAGFASMFADPVRTSAYAEALSKTVRAGDVVLEVGTGPGLFAVLAARLGARKVYALDPSPTVAIAREIVRANGVADRVEVIQALLEEVELPERVDVVVSDLRGMLPIFGSHLSTVMLARDRDLRPGGTLIPGLDRLHVGVACAPQVYRRFVGRWSGSYLDVDLREGRRAAVSSVYRVTSSEVRLASDAARWAVLDYGAITSTRVSGEAVLTVGEDVEGHGLVAWFETTLVEGIGYSTGPDQPEQVYGLAFFPWERPVALKGGEHVAVKLRADLIGTDYTWAWKTRVGPREEGTCRERFDQTTFDGQLLTREQITRVSESHASTLSPEGEIERFILAAMDGRRTNAEIARALVEAHLKGAPDLPSARRKVTNVVDRLGR